MEGGRNEAGPGLTMMKSLHGGHDDPLLFTSVRLIVENCEGIPCNGVVVQAGYPGMYISVQLQGLILSRAWFFGFSDYLLWQFPKFCAEI